MNKDNETLEAWFKRTHGLDFEPDDDQQRRAMILDIVNDEEQDDVDEMFRERQMDAAIESQRQQDAQVSRAAADYLRGGN